MDKPDLSTYGGRLKHAMQLADMSQAALARQVNVKQQNIAYLINKGQGSSYTNQFATALGVNADWLATGNGEMTQHVASLTTEQSDLSDSRLSFGFSNIRGFLRMTDTDGLVISVTHVDIPTQKIAVMNWSTTTQCYQVKGSELQPALFNGWVIAVDPALSPVAGEMLLCSLKNGSAVLGVYLYQSNDCITIQSLKHEKSKTYELAEIAQLLPIAGISMPSQIKPIE